MTETMPELFIGTSGWNYKAWKADFFAGVVQKKWLEHYTKYFNAVEVNATFYRLLQENIISSWKTRTPDDFFFSIKGSRYTTHTKRLKDPLQAVQKQKNNVWPLQHKIPAVLWQLPASFSVDMDRLRDFAGALQSWQEVRHALEFRDSSWFVPEVASLLEDCSLAVCISDAADWPRWDAVSTNMVYVRLHGRPQTYQSAYSDDELAQWARKVKAWRHEGRIVHVYFDNTDGPAAPKNAIRLKEILDSGGF
ncbi:MAG: DUF72 domain-containing protein [Desulfatiglandales bacterium]